MTQDLSSIFGFNLPINKKNRKVDISNPEENNYSSTYSPDMKKWRDAIKEVYEEMKNGKL